jgi:eukaryotic-like serine/threonine-protein kinase
MASIIPGYEYDIFISYRQKDNKYDGWVTEFVDNLKRELEATFKEQVSVYFDINPHDGLLETHDVNASLKEKLKCLVCIPIISLTYCDPKSFAWEHEFKAFIDQTSKDRFGLRVTLPGGNVANRLLPVRIHDLDDSDIKLFESELGAVLRSIDFVYKETGVNRQLRSKDDDVIKTPNQILYRDQINKVAHAIKDIIEGMKLSETHGLVKDKDIQVRESSKKKEPLIDEPVQQSIGKSEPETVIKENKPGRKEKLLFRKIKFLIPFVSIIIALFVIVFLVLNRRFKVRWAKEVALSQIEQLINKENINAAFSLVQKTEKYISDEPKLRELSALVTSKLTIITDPPGADVYIREYSDIKGKWKKLGKTPVISVKMPGSSFLLTSSFYLTRIEKPGYENILAVTAGDTLFRKLFIKGTIPPGMIYVEKYWDELKKAGLKENSGFFMDQYEVTNKQFKEFVDNGGYRNPQYWKNKFIKNNKILTLEAAISEFRDKTGQPGPATWEAGDYPDDQDNYPVSGISWYEAAAYAEYAGKSLPTADHWYSGAGFNYFSIKFYSKIVSISNFNDKGPELGGKFCGIGCFGTSDMAGNVREWCWNETPAGHIIRGGGWDDAPYMYEYRSQLPSFDRSAKNGFRCVQYIDREVIPESAFQKIGIDAERDFSREKPLPESTFRIYKNQFLYDSTALNSAIENRDESPVDWITEKITYNAAYEDERVIAYLFLPKNATPPFQTLIFYPGLGAFYEKDLVKSLETKWYIDYLLKSGRAVMCPVYKGTFERYDPLIMTFQGHQYTNWLIKWVKDFRRSIDYLETRKDINNSKLGYFGVSWGAFMGGIIPAVEDRLAVSILNMGGFYSITSIYPEADQINYVSRIKIPVLMLNGKYDMTFPLEKSVIPFYNLLGTPTKDKRLCVYETDHYVPKNEMIKETLNWLDHYLGPVK